jgi:hypothetical protein
MKVISLQPVYFSKIYLESIHFSIWNIDLNCNSFAKDEKRNEVRSWLTSHKTYIQIRDGRGRGLDPRGHVATGGRGEKFSLLFWADGVRVSLAYGRSGTGEAMNKKIRSSGGRGWMLTGSGGWKIFSGRNVGSSKIIDRCLHLTYVVSNILIGSWFSICQLQDHLFFVFSSPYYFSDKISIIDLY